jgi:hypothetical protein
MKQFKFLIGIFFMIGMPFPLLVPDTHKWYFGFLSLLFAFIGSGLTYGFSNYRTHPRDFGDLNGKYQPKINQVWMMFFVSSVINLFWAATYIG